MKAALALIACSLAAPALAGPAPTGLPLAPARYLDREVTSGTWMSLDVSPDGGTIVFDLLGEIYAMPASGGRARPLRQGLSFDSQPVYSPDGRRIAFVGDATGADNIWVMDSDGRNARPISQSDSDYSFVSPAWTADGKALFVSRYRADLNNFELWLYPLDGEPKLIRPIRDSAAQPRDAWRSSLGASLSRDGRYLYYARRIGGLELEQVKSWTIVRRDLSSGAETVAIAGTGARGADRETFFRPIVSPDGTRLAYATRRGAETELRLRDLASGSDIAIGPLDPDALQAGAWQDLSARYAFTPDGKALIISHQGHFERHPVDGGPGSTLAFTAPLHLAIGPSTRQSIREEEGPVRARLVQAPIASPDGRRIAFSALGGLFVAPAEGAGAPTRLPATPDPAFQPSWSPDGRTLLFVTWSEKEGGVIWSVPADGSAAPIRVSDLSAYYSYPVFSPDGASILAFRSSAAARQQTGFEFGKLREAELVSLPASGGPARVVTSGRIGGRPQFTDKAGTVYINTGEGLSAVDLASGARSQIASVKGAGYYFQDGRVAVDDVRISPDGRSLLAQAIEQVYLIPVPAGDSKAVDVSDANARKLTDIGADYFEFERGGSIDLSVGAHWQHRDASGAPKSERDLVVELPRDMPGGSLLLSGARVLTMAHGDKVIDKADILVTGDRIAAIGPSGTLAVPPGTPVRDLAGKFVLPGFIDEHDHIGNIRRDVLSLEDWGLRSRLSYGVTTSFDPSTLSIDMIAYQDLLDAGLMLGPRLRSTGPAVFSSNAFASRAQVRDVLRRYRDFYRLSNLKEYRSGNRRVREWVAQEARAQGLNPTTEGALSLKLDLTQILDGFAGNEHALPATLGEDVVALLAFTRTSYSTTLMVTNSGAPGADWFVATHDPAREPRIRRFWPPAAIRQKLLDRPWNALETERFPLVAAGAKKVAEAGGLVGMGAHGEVPGIGFHWEMEAHVIGGMSAMEALHAGTAGSAETIGRLADLGTIEPGKLADLVILDKDPLADIANSRSVDQVMRGGRLYDAKTLDSLWPDRAALPPPWFASKGAPEQWLPAAEGK